MDEATRPTVDWRLLADAVPGGVAITVDGSFVHVTETAAALLGQDATALVEAPWEVAFDQPVVSRLERDAFPALDRGGTWEGEIRTGSPAADCVELRLSVTDDGATVWSFPESGVGDSRAADAGGEADGARTIEHGTELGERLVARSSFVRTLLDAVNDIVYVIGTDGQLHLWNETLTRRLGYTDAELRAMHPKRLVPEDQHEFVPGLYDEVSDIADRRVEVDLLTTDGERITHEFTATTFEDPETGEQFRCGVARDITDRLERERRLERQRDDLATLDRISELLLETTRELVESSSREAVERTVCERLAASELYQFAWVGEPAFDGDRIGPRVQAGDGRGYLDAVSITVDGNETGRGPAAEAMRTGEVQVANIDDESFEPWHEEAAARGFESVAAVPIHHGNAVYGVLVVYATRPDAFSEREQAGFDVLGRTVGFVVHAARSRELLFADAVVELEFRAEDMPFTRLATACNCTVDLEGYVASTDRWVLYLDVDGAPASDVTSAAADEEAVLQTRAIDGDGDRVEIVVGTSSLFQTVADAGGTVRTASADPDGGRLVVEAPVAADVRAVVEHLTDAYPGLTLQARRDRDRDVATVGRPGGVLEELTDRQREALTAAFRAGYYDWPRGSTAEDVAGALDLAPATLHGHLRKAERRLLSALLDE